MKYRDYVQLQAEYTEIELSPDNDQKIDRLANFAKKATQVTGKNYDYYGGTIEFEEDFSKLGKSFDKDNTKIKKTQSEISEAENSFISYYNAQKN